MTFLVGIGFALTAACTNSCIDSARKLAAPRIPPLTLVALPALFEALIAPACIKAFGGFEGVHFQQPFSFLLLVLTSSALLLYSKLLYQRAIASAPLSLTVPYLSFTPAILTCIAFLFLGEQPSATGCVGVCIITLGGYLLSRKNAADKKADEQQEQHDAIGARQAACPAGPWSRETEAASAGGQQPMQLSSARSRSFPSLAASLAAPDVEAPQGSAVSHGGAGGKGAPVGVHVVQARAGRPPHPQPDQAWTVARPRPQMERSLAAAAPKTAVRSGLDWVPQDVLQKPAPAVAAAHDGAAAGGAAAGTGKSLVVVQHPASMMMIGVACLWSVTASLDKLGVMLSPSIWVYIAGQRVIVALLSCTALAISSPSQFHHLLANPLTLLLISMLELLAVVSFFEAIKHVFVSYVVAIKRCNILISVLVGGYLFKENIRSRLPYICLMLAGMSLIVLEPNSGTIHHTSHTSHT